MIGRSTAAGLRIPGEKDGVSRRHCELLLDDTGRVCIRDLGSTNGTFLNGRQLAPDALTPATSGASVKLGDVGFRLEYAAGSSAQPPAGEDASQEQPEPEQAAGPALPATEPLVAGVATESQPDLVTADEQPVTLAELEADEPVPAGGFGFLADAEPAADADEGWPMVTDEPPAAADEKLDDFFKGLS